MKKVALIILGMSCLAVFIIAMEAYPQMGRSLFAKESIMYRTSANYDNGTFTNKLPVNMTMDGFTFSKAMNFFFDLSRKPKEKLPYFHLTRQSFSENPGNLQVVWLGHSSMILDIDGVRLLIDPVFGNASPVPFTVNRFQPSPIARKDLPDVDAVVISHDHYDHLEMDTVKYLATRVRHFVVPLGLGSYLRKWGCTPEQIVELDWWQSMNIRDVEIVATPSRHFSGRGLGDRFKTQWASFVFNGNRHRAYYSGDGGYDGRFSEIGEKFGPFDLTMIESGAWDKSWEDVHLLPAQSVEAHIQLKGRYMLPVHWAAYDLAFHSWDEPIRMVSGLAEEKGVRLLTPQMGEVCIPGSTTHYAWWEAEEVQRLAVSRQE
ncbi:MBL fold metallo-hydrolase [Maridesulfovibrio sp. FT414]|uniref:MBL fold metallo-hydrolase n=1 Tax=Maridesulfovibrio sp. FT414 TaxID=2979469 RepID=UPI003D808B15